MHNRYLATLFYIILLIWKIFFVMHSINGDEVCLGKWIFAASIPDAITLSVIVILRFSNTYKYNVSIIEELL